MRRVFSIGALAVLAGCTVGPDYHQPEVATPPAYAEPLPQQLGEVELARWWQAFGDAELDRLIALALAENLDVKTAISRVREARIGVAAARAQGLPQLNAGGTGQHTETNQTAHLNRGVIDDALGGVLGEDATLPDLPKAVNLPETNTDTYQVGFDASWQIDVFGGVRRSVEGARARSEAAEWDARDAQVTVVSEVANAYLQLRQLQAEEEVALAEVARQNRSLQILGETARAGLVPEGDFSRQRAQLANAQASLGPIRQEEAARVHALAVLLARTTAEVAPELSVRRAETPPPPAVPPGLPSELLRRRPDIRAAERRLAAANAVIGSATADLYPRFSLTGMAQLVSQALANFVTIEGRQLTAVANVQAPLLDGGRRRATVEIRRQEHEQALLAYRGAVLRALRDVEDALARIDNERGRNAVLRAGVSDAERAVRAVDARYRTGLSNLVDVLDAQAAVLQQRNQLAGSDGALKRDLAALYRALGGGWSDEGARLKGDDQPSTGSSTTPSSTSASAAGS